MAQNEQEEHWSEGEDESNDTSNPSVNSEDLRNQIALSNAQLHELSKDDAKFFDAVRNNNDQAVQYIAAGKSKEALAYLTEAERYLQYGACCGKVIDRNLIICVLHNEAAAYQRIWAIEKCSKYIEATIYNLETSLQKDAEAYALVTLTEPALKPRQLELVCSVIRRKQTLVQYHLQYCALMSQLKNHTHALSSSFKAMALMKELFGTYYKYYKSYAAEERSNLTTYGKKLKLFKELASYRQDLTLPSYQSILKRVRWVLKEWRTKNASPQNEDVQNWVKSYSIGNAMQMQAYPYTQVEAHVNFKKEFELESIIRKVLLFAISYFTVATQIRLNEVDKFPNNEQEKRRSEDFQRSELYHLTSIKIFATFVPYESMFIKHVLHSYSNHYKPELTVDSVSFIADDQLEDGQQPQQQSAQTLLSSQQHQQKQAEFAPIEQVVVQHAQPINIPEPPQFKPISAHRDHRERDHPEPPSPQSHHQQHPHPQPLPSPAAQPLSHQSSSHSNQSHPVQETLSDQVELHKENHHRHYEQEQQHEHIRSLNSQPLKLKKKDLHLNALKTERDAPDGHRKNSQRPQSTRSNTKVGGGGGPKLVTSPRGAKPTPKYTEVRGQYYCGERSATKKRKNPDKKEKVQGDRTSRSLKPKLPKQQEGLSRPRGKSKGKEQPTRPKGSKSQKALKRKQNHHSEFEPMAEQGYFARKPLKPKPSTKNTKNTVSSKKRL